MTMAMTYIELIETFWLHHKKEFFKAEETTLYFYLLHVFNNIIKIDHTNESSFFPITELILVEKVQPYKPIEVLVRLKSRGMIDFKVTESEDFLVEIIHNPIQ